MIDLFTATFIGPIATDDVILQTVPADYRDLLLAVNGCILFGGGLHIRGACEHPEWHSLRQAWIGLNSLSNLYPNVQKTDIPFAQDAVGDQFLLRQDSVNRLNAETDSGARTDSVPGRFRKTDSRPAGKDKDPSADGLSVWYEPTVL